jgi:integrase
LVAAAQPGEYEALDRALYRTAAMTGLRQGELIALRWRDVDWHAARIRVRQNYVRGEFGTPKSCRSTRSVPMADVVGGELDRLYRASALRAMTSWYSPILARVARWSGPRCSAGSVTR